MDISKYIQNHRKFLPLIVLLGVLTLFAALFVPSMFTAHENKVAVSITDFDPGTTVSYEIASGETLLERGQETLNEDGRIDLLALQGNREDKLSYKLKVQPPEDLQNQAEILELFLNLNPKTGHIDFLGNGLDSFADITVKDKKNSTSQKLSADWAGAFSTEALNEKIVNSGMYDKQIELAFNRAGISTDALEAGNGKIEVLALFGVGSRPGIAEVRNNYVQALQRMSLELSAVMNMQSAAVGMFFDAKIQLQTQRKFQQLMARAHKDYHPSETMCKFGTFVRSMANTEHKSQVDKLALNKILMHDYLGYGNKAAGYGPQVSGDARLRQYKEYYCDPRDNTGALAGLCPQPASALDAAHQQRLNIDIDYTRALAMPLTLDIDFTDGPALGTAANDLSAAEADIVALAKNLYFPEVFELPDSLTLETQVDPFLALIDGEQNAFGTEIKPHYDSRSFASKMNVAHTSFLNIVGMKARAPVGQPTTATTTSPTVPANVSVIVQPLPPNPPLAFERDTPVVRAEDAGWAYMKALLKEFGIQDENSSGDIDDEINTILGERPSYYAQMEILTKKIYEHPNFYTNLYDKPVNVDRIGASVDAITLMQERDRFESLLRREMLASLLVEEGLATHVKDINSTIFFNIQRPQIND
ncbi:MAG: hypothetical protein GC137_07060 [Alphaproteobacteria bacterium]|nr:hypothetical protein [Alphaproteobacteria bacterium]